ncbi:hypothetical protein BRAS3809_3320005 [Bradyrhizobium sp. STM 3809]|nr:hypothetical protein BRAS3809_3320005 [Bradyrhizobium sp. STM 3809]
MAAKDNVTGITARLWMGLQYGGRTVLKRPFGDRRHG